MIIVTTEPTTTMETTYAKIITKYFSCFSLVISQIYVRTNDELTSLFKEVESIIGPHTHMDYSFKLLNILTKAQISAIITTFKELRSADIEGVISTTVDVCGSEADMDGIREIIKQYKEGPTTIDDFIRYISSYVWIPDIGAPTDDSTHADNE